MQFFTWKQLFRNSILEHGCTFYSFLNLVSRCLFLYMYDYNGRGFVIHIYKEICGPHKYTLLFIYIYTYTTVSVPSSEMGPPPSLPQASVPHRNQRGGGGSQFGGLKKKPSLFYNLKHSRPQHSELFSPLYFQVYSYPLILSFKGQSHETDTFVQPVEIKRRKEIKKLTQQ